MYHDDKCIPMVYPLFIEDEGLLPYLHKNKIFQGRWWEYLLNEIDSNMHEYWLTKNLIPITIDQRYGRQELEHINNLIKSLGIVEIKRAFPSSRNSKLLKVYEISSTSSKEDLYANAVNNVNELSKFYSLKKYRSLVLLNYDKRLTSFLFWLQQLLGESLGKKGKGLLPLISLAPKDHHSLLQLYLDGPKDKIFLIFYSNFKNKKLNKIVSAQRSALKQVFLKKKIPFREIEIKNYSEETLGELFSYFILETVLIGKIVKINPFDQPAVEEVKKIAKKKLSS